MKKERREGGSWGMLKIIALYLDPLNVFTFRFGTYLSIC
jgi:hypothetical protein